MEASALRHGVNRNLREQYRLLKKPPERRTAEELRMIATTLVGISFFERLDPAVKLQCCSVLRHQFLKADRTVFEEGDVGTLFYVVLEGSVGVYIRDVPADELEHANLEEQRRKRASVRQKAVLMRMQRRLSEATSKREVGMSKRIVSQLTLWRNRCRDDAKVAADDSTEAKPCADGDDQQASPGGATERGQGSNAGSCSSQDTETDSDTDSEEEATIVPMPHGSGDQPAPLKEVASLRQGMAFGEIALENDQPRTATVRTISSTHFAVLERADYQSILTQAFEQDRRERLEFLAGTSLFARTPLEELAKISPMLHQRELRKNDLVYEAGSDTLQVYFVRHGEFAVRRPIEGSGQLGHVSATASTGGSGTTDSGDARSASATCRSRRPTVAVEGASVGRSRRPTVAGAARASICASRKSVSGVAALAAAAVASSANATELRSSRRNSCATGQLENAKNNWGRQRSHWCTITLVTPPQVFGLADYLCGSRVHTDRVVCQSSTGCVYGILAKELMSHLDAATRARMMRGASAHDQFVKNRTHVLSQLALTSRASVDSGCNVYSPEGRLRAITAALESLSEEDKQDSAASAALKENNSSRASAPSPRSLRRKHSSGAAARLSLQSAIKNEGKQASSQKPLAEVPHVQPVSARPSAPMQVPKLRTTWHSEDKLASSSRNTLTGHHGIEAVASRTAAAAYISNMVHGSAETSTRALELPWLDSREACSSRGAPDEEGGSLIDKPDSGHLSTRELDDMDPIWFPLFRKTSVAYSPPSHCASKAPPGKMSLREVAFTEEDWCSQHERRETLHSRSAMSGSRHPISGSEGTVESGKAAVPELCEKSGQQVVAAPAEAEHLPRLLGSRFGSMEKPVSEDGACLTEHARPFNEVYVAGNQIDVWSNSTKAWCHGHVEKVEDGQAHLCFRLPCGSSARKVVSTSEKAAVLAPLASSAGALAAAALLRDLAHFTAGISIRQVMDEFCSDQLLANAPSHIRDSLSIQDRTTMEEPLARCLKRARQVSSKEEVIDLSNIYSFHREGQPCS